MRWSSRSRADLARLERPTSRDTAFMVVVALVMVAIAQITDPGSLGELALLAPAVAAFALRGLVPRVPAEVFAAVVLAPVGAAVGRGGTSRDRSSWPS